MRWIKRTADQTARRREQVQKLSAPEDVISGSYLGQEEKTGIKITIADILIVSCLDDFSWIVNRVRPLKNPLNEDEPLGESSHVYLQLEAPLVSDMVCA